MTTVACFAAPLLVVVAIFVCLAWQDSPLHRREDARRAARNHPDDPTRFKHRDYVAEALRQLDYGIEEAHVHPVNGQSREAVQRRLHDAGMRVEGIGPAGVDAGVRLAVRRRT